jgi:hypothetical protein
VSECVCARVCACAPRRAPCPRVLKCHGTGIPLYTALVHVHVLPVVCARVCARARLRAYACAWVWEAWGRVPSLPSLSLPSFHFFPSRFFSFSPPWSLNCSLCLTHRRHSWWPSGSWTGSLRPRPWPGPCSTASGHRKTCARCLLWPTRQFLFLSPPLPSLTPSLPVDRCPSLPSPPTALPIPPTTPAPPQLRELTCRRV